MESASIVKVLSTYTSPQQCGRDYIEREAESARSRDETLIAALSGYKSVSRAERSRGLIVRGEIGLLLSVCVCVCGC